MPIFDLPGEPRRTRNQDQIPGPESLPNIYLKPSYCRVRMPLIVPTGSRNGRDGLVRVGPGGDLEVPEFRREVLRVVDPLSPDHRVPGHCLAHTIASVTSGRSV